MPAWYEAKTQRDKEKKARRATRAEKPGPAKKSRTSKKVQQIAALLTNEHVQNMTAAELDDLADVIEDARATLKKRRGEE